MGLNIIQNIWVGDFETATTKTKYYQQTQDTTVIYGYCKNISDTKSFEFRTIEEMIECLKTENTGVMIYFHNLSFDGAFILKYLATKYKMFNKLPRQTVGFTALRQGSNIYEIVLQVYSNKTNNCFKIVFRCSYRILSAPVESLGKDVGLSKFTGNEAEDFYDLEPVEDINLLPQDYKDYCKRDVEIVRRALIEFDSAIEFIKQQWPFLKGFKWNGKLTASSISLKLQKAWVLHNYNKSIVSGFKHSNEDNLIADKFYFGGFTQFNNDYQNHLVKCKKGVCVDINSAHPFSMTKRLPFGKLYDYEKDKYDEWGLKESDVIIYYEIKVGYAVSKTGGIASLFNWNKQIKGKLSKNESQFRYVFEQEDFTCYYQKEEWDFLQTIYHFENVEIIKKYWMLSTDFLKEFVNIIYKFKEDYKKENKKGLSNTFKIILNSGYGIHAKRNDFNEYYVCEDKKEYEKLIEGTIFTFNKKEYEVIKSSGIEKLPNQYIRVVRRVKLPKANNKFIASTITAYSRIYLLENAMKFGVDNVLYMDTDSIYIKDYKGKLEDYLWIDKYALGAWDIEVEYDHFSPCGAKVYYAVKDKQIIKAKYSGINQRWLKDNLSYDTFKESLLTNASTKKIHTNSGMVLVDKDYTHKPRFH